MLGSTAYQGIIFLKGLYQIFDKLKNYLFIKFVFTFSGFLRELLGR